MASAVPYAWAIRLWLPAIAYALALHLATSTSIAGAQLQPQAWQLELDAPADESCLSAAELRDEVDERAGTSGPKSAVASEGALRVRVSIHPHPKTHGFRATVRTLDAAGATRGVRWLAVEHEGCRALDVALVLVVAALVGVERATSPEPEEPEPEEPEPPKPPPRPPVAIAVTYPRAAAPGPPPAPTGGAMLFTAPSSTRPGRPWRFDALLGARAIAGLLPGTHAALSASASAHSDAFQVVAGGLLLPGAAVPVGARGRSSFTAALGELAACAIVAQPGDGSLGFCAGMQAGAIFGRVKGLWLQRASQQPVLELSPAVRAQLPLGRWLALHFSGGAAFPLLAPRYSYVDESGRNRAVHVVEMGLWGELGLGLRLLR